MISIEEAIERVLAHAGTQPVARVPLEEALERTLAQPVIADIDSPPFDKSLMDGYAVRCADLPGGRGSLPCVGEILAGQVSTQPLEAGTVWQIMTGAPIPTGADAVVMIERSTRADNRVNFDDSELARGQNIMVRGLEFNNGETLLAPGHPLGPAELGLCASVGVTEVDVFQKPTIAIVSTGNEIVPPSRYPEPGQIRNSNAWTLYGAATRAGASPTLLGIATDDDESLRKKIELGLRSDLLVLSGGVSAGKKDLVPRLLEEAGVHCHFHGVAFKPGKPLWFGSHERGIVFGLPGNPVSVLACFRVFIETALRARQQHAQPRPEAWPIPLAEDFVYSTRRPTYHPACIETTPLGLAVRAVSWQGSPDLRALTSANALLIVPAGDGPYPAGSIMQVLALR